MKERNSPSPRAIEALKETFAEWAIRNRDNSREGWGISTISKDIPEESEYPDDDPEWWKDKTPEQLLPHITDNPGELAQEIHQIRFDAGLTRAAEFLTDFRNKLLKLGCDAEEIVTVLNFIDEHEEHSH